ncbi:MAG: hypothetical protein KME29_06425 [Calothrix sp. FI2-JRJ7]|nr:hypothetical protein [Calothrix sp. FI2-JRJ7]
MKLTIQISSELAQRIQKGNYSPLDLDALMRLVKASMSMDSFEQIPFNQRN